MQIERVERSRDGSIKFAYLLPSKGIAEAIYFNFNAHHRGPLVDSKVICLSSQIGCDVGCPFCETGKMNFAKNLSGLEMEQEVLMAQEYVSSRGLPPAEFYAIMGMGEPLMNTSGVLDFFKRTRKSVKRISLSTSGISIEISRLAKDPSVDFELFVSLHTPYDSQRNQLVPSNRFWPIKKLLEAGEEYAREKGEKTTLTYMVLPNVNDSREHFNDLGNLVDPKFFSFQFTCVNSLDSNKTEKTRKRFMEDIVPELEKIMDSRGITFDVQLSKGFDIKGGCGQLSTEITKEGKKI
ncbi:MAG: radical SAM protein [Nanoarchaeota archaeon]